MKSSYDRSGSRVGNILIISNVASLFDKKKQVNFNV